MASNDPILLNVFIQVNTVRGFRYLDDAGKIMNRLDKEFPQKSVDLKGLNMINPESKIRALNVTTERIWVHSELPDTLRYATDHARGYVEDICQIIDVASFNRMGLRLNYLVPAEEEKLLVRSTFERAVGDPLKGFIDKAADNAERAYESMTGWTEHELSIELRLHPVKRQDKNEAPAKLPETALMLDLDISRSGEFGIRDFNRFLREAQEWTSDSVSRLAMTLVPGR